MNVLRWLLLALLAPIVLASETTTKYDMVKVADGVYAFIAPEPKSALVNGNCVAIIGDDGVVMVDTGQIPSLTRRMLADIRKLTDKPVRYVINTHWHWDHNLANFVVRDAFPDAAIISTAFTRQLLVDSTPKVLQFFQTSSDKMLDVLHQRLAAATSDVERANLTDDIDDFESGAAEVKSARFVPPNETVDGALSLFLGKREVRVFHPGRANTAGDLAVYVPDAKVLITGDIVVMPTPYATASYFNEWIAALKKLSAMEFTGLVPGHGPVQHDRAYLDKLTALLQAVVDQVGAAVRDGLSIEETAKRVTLEEFRGQFAGDDRRRNRSFNEYFLVPAVKTAWHQARGEATTESPFE